jgi:CelD/BcsL family acetyltransferase involved in cellulose biosynthesis
MTVQYIDPIQDPRWAAFLDRRPDATIFHTPAWLEVLRRTYGHAPMVVTTAAPGADLSNGVVFSWVKSWLTGSRIVSLPFSDHCEPLVDNPEELKCLIGALAHDLDASKAKYVEIRPIRPMDEWVKDLEKTGSFCLHQLDLRPGVDQIFAGFHKNCVQRKIRRAEREDLRYEEGRSASLVAQFYNLVVLTRQRQQLLPQPLAWFRNLVAALGDQVKIHLASKDGHAIAGILTLSYKDTLVYKYGCSDKRFNNLGGTQLLFWMAIQQAKKDGLTRFDLGRSDWDTPGLLRFKDRWGARRAAISYWRYGPGAGPVTSNWLAQVHKHVLGHMPAALLPSVGSLMYRHYA